MAPWPDHQYRRAAHGAPDALLDAALDQAHAVQKRGLPAVLSLGHLAHHARVSYKALRTIVERKTDAYVVHQVRKKSGGYRLICRPAPDLMRTQTWIHRSILKRRRCHPAAVAYAPTCSPVSAARRHCGARWLIKVDVRRFFESIPETRVYWVFRRLGYERLPSFEMARICTRSRFSHWKIRPGYQWFGILTESEWAIPSYEFHHVGHLPQGAPTSPMLSNLVMMDLDSRVDEWCRSRGLVYTRYSDDIVVSAHHRGFNRRMSTQVVHFLRMSLERDGFRLNESKVGVSPPGARKVVLGLNVDSRRPRLTKRYRRELEAHLYARGVRTDCPRSASTVRLGVCDASTLARPAALCRRRST